MSGGHGVAWPRQICRVWGSWALCPLGGCRLIDEFQKQHGFWDPVLGRDIGQRPRDPGPRRHLSNPKTQAWRGQRRGDSGWTQRPSCLTVAPRQDGGAPRPRGPSQPIRYFADLWKIIRYPKGPLTRLSQTGSPSSLSTGSGLWALVSRTQTLGCPLTSHPLLQRTRVGTVQGPRDRGRWPPGSRWRRADGPSAAGGRLPRTLRAVPSPTARQPVTGAATQCLICIPQVWGSSPRHFPPPEPPSPPISTLRSVLVWGGSSCFVWVCPAAPAEHATPW